MMMCSVWLTSYMLLGLKAKMLSVALIRLMMVLLADFRVSHIPSSFYEWLSLYYLPIKLQLVKNTSNFCCM